MNNKNAPIPHFTLLSSFKASSLLIFFIMAMEAWAGNPKKVSKHILWPDTRFIARKDTLKPPVISLENPIDGIDDDVYERDRQEFLRTRDPFLNQVPSQRLIQAKQMMDALSLQPAANGSSTSALNSLSWTERGPNNVGGRTRALLFDMNDKINGYKKVFAGGVGGGLWYTLDITANPVNWVKINDFYDNIAMSCIYQNPNNLQEMYAGTGEGFGGGDAIRGLGLYHSLDGGNTWTLLPSTNSFYYINSVLVDNLGNVYIAGNNFGIQKSSDQGLTWTQVLGMPLLGLSTTGGDIQLAANGDIYASLGLGYGNNKGQIYLSDYSLNGTNTGNAGTWRNISPNPSGKITSIDSSYCSRVKLAVAPGNPNIVYAMMEGYKSNNLTYFQEFNKAFNTWTVRTVPQGPAFTNGQAWYSMAMAVDPNHVGTLIIGSLDAVKSVDSGKTWTQITNWFTGSGSQNLPYVHADHHNYAYAPGSSDRILMGTDGGVFYSANGTSTNPENLIFQSKNNGYNVTQFYSIALHPNLPNYFLGGTQDNGTQQFSQAGMGSTATALGGDGGNCFIDPINPNIQIASYTYNYFYLSTDGGNNWAGYRINGNGGFINPADYDPKSKNLYSGNSSGTYLLWKNIIASASKPDTFTVSVPGFNNRSITYIGLSPSIHNRVYFGLDNGTIVMVDHADSVNGIMYKVFNPNPAYGNVSVSCISVDPVNENHILISYSNYGIISVYETQNAGASNPVWTSTEGNLPDIPVRWCLFYPGNTHMALLGTDLGVWSTLSLSGTSTQWLPTNSGLSNTRVQMMKFRMSDRTLAAATHGRGLFTSIIPVFGLDSLLGKNQICLHDSSQFIPSQKGGIWSSDNPGIASVDSTGKVKGISVGMANIFYVIGGVYTQKTVNILALPSASIGGPANTSIYPGDYVTLFASGGGNKYLWSTGDTTQFVNIYKAGTYTVSLTNSNGCSVISHPVQVVILPPLSTQNLSLTLSSVTCKGGQDGSVKIKALSPLPYSALVTGPNLGSRQIPFTDSLKIAQLSAGTYSICISLTNQSGFNQCFTVIITEPQDLSVYTSMDKPRSSLQLSMGGGNTYNIDWNNTHITTAQSNLSLPLKNGMNTLQVSTDRYCQGIIQQQFEFNASIFPYPVPFHDILNIDFGNLVLVNLELEIFDISDGKQVWSEILSNTTGLVQMNTGFLRPGTYALRIKSENLENIYKISKL